MALENNVTIFMRETNEVVKCPICNQYCPEPEESYGYTSLSAARAGVKKKHWQSVCALVDNEDHKEAQILWERLHGCCAYWRAGVTWTNNEEKDFLSRLEIIRSKINDELKKKSQDFSPFKKAHLSSTALAKHD